MVFKIHSFPVALLISLLITANASSDDPRYEFEKIASTADPQFEVFISQSPEITDDARVYFLTRIPDLDDATVVWKDGQFDVVTTDSTGIDGSTTGIHQVNQLGEVVFIDSDLYIWTATDGLESLYSSNGPAMETFQFRVTKQPNINEEGQIAFIATGLGYPNAVFLGDRTGVVPTAMASTGGPLFEGFNDFFSVLNTDDGDLLVRGRKNGEIGIHLLTAPGQSIPVAVSGADAEYSFIAGFDASRNRQLAFVATLPNKNSAVVRSIDGKHELITQDNPQYEIAGNSPAINSKGEIVFRADYVEDQTVKSLLLTGPDFVEDRVIASGETLLGQTVIAVYAGAGSLNDRGQIAFYAILKNERGIFLATPIIRGDTNNDGLINLLDVDPFAESVSSGTYLLRADMNCDGVVSLLDVAPFVEALISG